VEILRMFSLQVPCPRQAPSPPRRYSGSRRAALHSPLRHRLGCCRTPGVPGRPPRLCRRCSPCTFLVSGRARQRATGASVDVAGIVEAGEVADARVRLQAPGVAVTGVRAETAARWGRWGCGQCAGRQEQDREADGEQQGDQGTRRIGHTGLLPASAWGLRRLKEHVRTAVVRPFGGGRLVAPADRVSAATAHRAG